MSRKRTRTIVMLAAVMLVISGASVLSALIVERNARHRGEPSKWRLAHETVAANSKDSFVTGSMALNAGYGGHASRHKTSAPDITDEASTAVCPAESPGVAGVSKLFFWGKLMILPARTEVTSAGSDETGATKVRVTDGPHQGQTVWLFAQSPEQLGFLAPAE